MFAGLFANLNIHEKALQRHTFKFIVTEMFGRVENQESVKTKQNEEPLKYERY